jgi:hypothetical protein
VKRQVARRTESALRIGAAALTIGNLSLATEVAIALRDRDFDAWRAHVDEPNLAAFEQALSELHGRLLGVDPQRRLSKFVSFAEEVVATLPPPPPARDDETL